jgi:hypothetical protein
MVKSRTCVQKVARSYVHVALSSGFSYCRGTSKASKAAQEDPTKSIANYRGILV